MNKLLSFALVLAFVVGSLAAAITEGEVDCEKRDLRCLKRRELAAINDEIKRACISAPGFWCEEGSNQVSRIARRLAALPNDLPPSEAAEFENGDLEEEDKRELGGCASRHLGFWCKKKRALIDEKLNDLRSTIDKYSERKRAPGPAKPGCQSKYLGFWC